VTARDRHRCTYGAPARRPYPLEKNNGMVADQAIRPVHFDAQRVAFRWSAG
jgi:hypothetical protein